MPGIARLPDRCRIVRLDRRLAKRLDTLGGAVENAGDEPCGERQWNASHNVIAGS
jgi:hypothetical protein